MLLPDPRRSRAVLVGVDDYEHLTPLPGVALGVDRLADLLRDPTVWGLPRDNVTVLRGEVSAGRILKEVRNAGEAATETLLVYFGGHGLRECRSKELYLALADADKDHLTIGTLRYAALRDMVRHEEFPARRRMMFLDCCYSGLATSMGGGSAAVLERYDLANLLVEQGAGEGDPGEGDDTDFGGYVMTSASGTEKSYTPAGSYPLFTGALIEALQKGIPGAGPTLSVHGVWRHVLKQRIGSTPQYKALNTQAEEPWVRNRAVDARPAVPPRRVLPAEPDPAPSPDARSDELKFTTVKGGGYRIGAVKGQMEGVIAKVEDPRLGWQAVSPHFRTVPGRWFWGWDRAEVDAHIEERRAEPTEFVDALRLLLARQGVTVLPDGGPLIGQLPSRYAKKGAVTFTKTDLCLKSSAARMSIPYSELQSVALTTSQRSYASGVPGPEGQWPDNNVAFITHVIHGHRSLEFREDSPTPVRRALRAFLPAMADLRGRHPEWFRMDP
ncbi:MULTISPECIES: caspase family protein [Streptomyces]|uniref:caspase family protein n=1 Tax=Streptomyces TaxID=1883 RepID=UPI000A9CE666|nr:caspase family protein [Streptomyces durhamensis]